MTNELNGKSIIGFSTGRAEAETFSAFDPVNGRAVGPTFYSADTLDLEMAADLADEAALPFGKLSGADKALFLRQIADNIESLGDTLIHRAMLETGLPEARFVGERGRTCGQLRLFANLLDDGSWVDARIDRAAPERLPQPKPDVRSMLMAVGPAAIFCASNFPLAFSVAGGDTASALAAGCPVIVYANRAHPGTAELVGQAVSSAVKQRDLPEGVFSLLFADSYEIGQKLVAHSAIRAVGFTGSRAGGMALMDIAAKRPVPIPVFAEMSSINPVFILPGALREDPHLLAAGLHASFNLGFGQFCTKPGVVILSGDDSSVEFIRILAELTELTNPVPLLTKQMAENYQAGTQDRQALGDPVSGLKANTGFEANATFFQTDVRSFLDSSDSAREIFGPTTLLVKSESREELLKVAKNLEGQLTASIFGSEQDLTEYSDLIEILKTKAGRLIFNGFPTGVEVCHAMVHGGPYPAASDSRSTSVGTRAIERFSRLVCFQDFPQQSLPPELADQNLLGIWRMVDGMFNNQPL